MNFLQGGLWKGLEEIGGGRERNFMEGCCIALASPRRVRNFLRDNLEARRGRLTERDNGLQGWGGGTLFFISIHGNFSMGPLLTKSYSWFNRS